jgi:hypothetical protein
VLDAAEEALYEIAIFVQVLIETTLHNAIASGRDDGLNFMDSQMTDDGVGIVGFVCAERIGQEIAQQRQRLGAIAGLTAREPEACQ